MNRFHFILLLSLIVVTPSLAQTEDDWLSLSRLSVSLHSFYHFSPWKAYNNSLQLVEEAVRYDHFYENPNGSFERVRGDASGEIQLSYNFLNGVSLELMVGMTRTGSNLSLQYNSPFSPVPVQHEQELQLGIFHFGGGLKHEQQLAENINLVLSASYQQVNAAIDFSYRTLEYEADQTYAVELNKNTGMLRGAAGLEIVLYGPVRVATTIEYRSLKLVQPSGRGTRKYVSTSPFIDYEFSYWFDAMLAEADGYFGIDITKTEPGYSADEDLLHVLWERTSAGPWPQTIRPTTLDLSGFGASLSVKVGL